jgi:hypothetical protein
VPGIDSPVNADRTALWTYAIGGRFNSLSRRDVIIGAAVYDGSGRFKNLATTEQAGTTAFDPLYDLASTSTPAIVA